jgi:hypothetical protein
VISGDAGDGAQHFQVNGAGRVIDASGSTDLRVAYLKVPSANQSFAYFNGGTQIEIDHCYYYKVAGSSSDEDNFAYFGVNGSTWDVNKIHDCVFYCPHQNGGAGDGDDFIQGGDSGVSIYNNSLIGYNVSSYPRGQHQDGWQPLGGSYFKFYNNYCQNIGNYALFGDGLFGPFTNFLCFNNVGIITDPTVASLNPQGLIIGSDGGYYSQNNNTWDTMTNCAIVNNLVIDYTQANTAGHMANGFNYTINAQGQDKFINCIGYNNIVVNGGSFFWESTVANGANPVLSVGQASSNFVSFSPNSATPANNNFNLRNTATALIGQGINLTNKVASLRITGPDFTQDFNGNPRPTSGAWDIGPYQYVSTPTPTPTPLPTPTP